MSTTSLYFLTMLDNFHGLLIAINIIAGSILLITISLFFIAKEEKMEEGARTCKSLNKILIPIFILSGLFLAFLPSTKQAVFIYMAEKITNNEDAKEIPKNTVKFLNLKLQEYIKDQEININKKGEN